MTAALLRIHPATQLFRQDYAANGADLPGAGIAWLDARRKGAMEYFAAAGVPTRRVEAWKYSDLANMLDAALVPATEYRGHFGDFAEDPFAALHLPRIVFVNGFLHRDSLPAVKDVVGLETIDLGALDTGADVPDWVKDNLGLAPAANDQPLGALSLGLMRGGLALRVAAGTTAALHLSFLNPARGHVLVSHARILLVVEEGASLTLLESHRGEEAVEQILANLGIDIVLKKNAALDHVRLQTEAATTLQVATLNARLERDARYGAFIVSLGARFARLDMNVVLADTGAEAALTGIIAHDHEGHSDVTTVMDHASPHTKSRQLFKSVLGGKARAITQGRVIVREGAAKSDSHQLFKAMLLGERAEADAKPELEIYADDVVCGHGTAIGAIDKDALFYLRARGIAEQEARQMLVRAFLEDAFTGFADAALHDALWSRIEQVLAAMGEAP